MILHCNLVVDNKIVEGLNRKRRKIRKEIIREKVKKKEESVVKEENPIPLRSPF